MPQVRAGFAAPRCAMRGASNPARWGTLHSVLPLHWEKPGADFGFLLLVRDPRARLELVQGDRPGRRLPLPRGTIASTLPRRKFSYVRRLLAILLPGLLLLTACGGTPAAPEPTSQSRPGITRAPAGEPASELTSCFRSPCHRSGPVARCSARHVDTLLTSNLGSRPCRPSWTCTPR